MKVGFLRYGLLTSLTLFLTACTATQWGGGAVTRYNDNPLTVSIPAELSGSEVDAAAARVLAGRGWTVTERSAGRTVGTLQRAGYDATAILEREGQRVIIRTDTTRKPVPGAEAQPIIPINWLRYLQRDLNQQLIQQATR